jgi:hypothetical protein
MAGVFAAQAQPQMPQKGTLTLACKGTTYERRENAACFIVGTTAAKAMGAAESYGGVAVYCGAPKSSKVVGSAEKA